jgi:Spy/CpxP family protein refolding chaperone
MAIGTVNLYGQGNGNRSDKIEKLKIEFISEKLNLSPATKKEFWPVYNEYDNAKKVLFRKYRKQYRDQNLSMQDVELRMEREKEFMDLREKYINRFAKILTPVQLTDLKRAERQFKKLLLNRAKSRR